VVDGTCLVCAGFDGASGDPIGGCSITASGYAWMTHQLMTLAGGRVILALEVGTLYVIKALGC